MQLRSELSKRYIAESLIALMNKKDYSKITIRDITDKAGLSQMAYYRNFNSKDEIIKYHLDSITNDFIKRTNIVFDFNNLNNYLITLFTHLEEQKELGITLLKNNLIHYVKDEFDKIFKNKSLSLKEEYNYYFISGGLYNIYYYWLKNGCKESPKELANMFLDFLK